MKRKGDLAVLFLFILIFSCSTFIFYRSVSPPHFLLATPFSRLQTEDFSLYMQGEFQRLFHLLLEQPGALYGWMEDSLKGPVHWVMAEIPRFYPGRSPEKEDLPALSFQGIEAIYYQKEESDSFSREVSTLKEVPPSPQIDVVVPSVDREELPLLHPLSPEKGWELESNPPAILIYHSHTAETFQDDPSDIGTGHVAPGEQGLITAVGKEMATTLFEDFGIPVHHEKRVHDYHYSLSYHQSRKTLTDLYSHLEWAMVLDIHRDALGINNPQEIRTSINGESVARVMIVVASDELGLSHPQWRKNLQFANRLKERMEEMYPGLLRRIDVRNNRLFNQDLHPNSLLLEIGDYANTSTEAIRTARLLAPVLSSLLKEP